VDVFGNVHVVGVWSGECEGCLDVGFKGLKMGWGNALEVVLNTKVELVKGYRVVVGGTIRNDEVKGSVIETFDHPILELGLGVLELLLPI
jgi:hypothetical protein